MASVVELGACAWSRWRWPWFHVTGLEQLKVRLQSFGTLDNVWIYGWMNFNWQSASGRDQEVWSLNIRTLFILIKVVSL